MTTREREIELGFRDAPDIASISGLSYMGRIVEARAFIGAFYNLVGHAQTIAKDAPKDLLERAKRGEFAFYDFKVHAQFVNEIMLVRAVESFDLYILSVLREIFEAQPNMLKSEAPIDAATVIELAGNVQEIVRHIAEKKLHDLSYLPLTALQKFFKERTNIDIFSSREIYETVVVAAEVRNLIAHNDCRINKQFEIRTRGIPNPLKVSASGKVIISDLWLRKACYTLDGAVFDIDAAALEKYALKTHSAMGMLTVRRAQ